MNQLYPFVRTAREALELRRKTLNWWSSDSPFLGRWLVEGFPGETPEFAARLRSHQQAIFRHGDLFLVSDEMTEVTRAASLTLPNFTLEREDTPSEMGLLLFHHAPCTTVSPEGERGELVGVSWRIGPSPYPADEGRYGVFFVWYEDRDGGTLVPGVARQDEARAANKQLLPKLLPCNWSQTLLGEDFTPFRQTAPLAAHVISAFLLMQQPLAQREREQSPRVDRKRAARSGITENDVTVVRLRHLSTFAAGVVRPVEWRHRWIVRGHWRNQWLPSRGVHRPTWINPHVKGPEDRPLKATEKVNVWSR